MVWAGFEGPDSADIGPIDAHADWDRVPSRHGYLGR
jgi:hypothetical protein